MYASVAPVPGATVTIRNSEFGFNGAGDGRSHGIYVNEVAKLDVANSYFHDTSVGHNLKSRAIWGRSFELATRQLEEIFCDYYGLHIFGLSFLHAFRYFLSPSLGQYRINEYPPIKERALFVKEAAEQLKTGGIK